MFQSDYDICRALQKVACQWRPVNRFALAAMEDLPVGRAARRPADKAEAQVVV